MFFQTAGIEVSLWVPPLVAFAISFFTSMGGVSGAFLLLPFQMSFMGYSNPSVSATNQVFNVVAIPSGVYRYWREGRMVWPLTWIVVLGTLPGVFIGAMVRVHYLPDSRNFKLFAAVVLLHIGFKMVADVLKNSKSGAGNGSESRFQDMLRNENSGGGAPNVLPTAKITHFNWKRMRFTFYRETYDVSFWSIFIFSGMVGIIGGIYGIGGGSIIAPFFITFFELPVYIVAGAALMGTFVTSVAGVAFYQAIAPFYQHLSVAPDWQLGILFGTGGMAGMYLGARCQKFVPAKAIKWMLASVMVFTAAKYVLDFLGYG